MGSRLYVGNLSFDLDEDSLRHALEDSGGTVKELGQESILASLSVLSGALPRRWVPGSMARMHHRAVSAVSARLQRGACEGRGLVRPYCPISSLSPSV